MNMIWLMFRFDPWSWGNMTVWDTLEGEFPRFVVYLHLNSPGLLIGLGQLISIRVNYLWVIEIFDLGLVPSYSLYRVLI